MHNLDIQYTVGGVQVAQSRPTLCDPIDYAAAANSLQSCPTLCDPIDGSPPGIPPYLGFSRREHWSGRTFPSMCEVTQSCVGVDVGVCM